MDNFLIFVPLYNITVSEEVFNKEIFNGCRIISSKEFFEEYLLKLQGCDTYKQLSNILLRNTYKYSDGLNNKFTIYTLVIDNSNTLDHNINKFEEFITKVRLYTNLDIKFCEMFLFSPRGIGALEKTIVNGVEPTNNKEKYFCSGLSHISRFATFKPISDNIANLEIINFSTISSNLRIPLNFFNLSYNYDDNDPFKIVLLETCLECCLNVTNREDILDRSSIVLKDFFKDNKNIDNGYNLRCDVVHKGKISLCPSEKVIVEKFKEDIQSILIKLNRYYLENPKKNYFDWYHRQNQKRKTKKC